MIELAEITTEAGLVVRPLAVERTSPREPVAVNVGINVGAEVEALLGRSMQERFGDEGLTSALAQDLTRLIAVDAPLVIATLDSALRRLNSDEMSGEALRWVGAVDHPQSWARRRTLLERYLHSPSPRTRYAAAVGLAKMDDPSSAPALSDALRRETHERVRYQLGRVLNQLIETRRCLVS